MHQKWGKKKKKVFQRVYLVILSHSVDGKIKDGYGQSLFSHSRELSVTYKHEKHHLNLSLSVICHSPRFNTLRHGSCVILSKPLLVILVQP